MDKPTPSRQSLRVKFKDLLPRLVVGLLLIAVALFGGWQGGLFFDFLMGAAALLIFREWSRMKKAKGNKRVPGFFALGAATVLADAQLFPLAFVALGAGVLWYVVRFRPNALGVLYAGVPTVSLIWLRQDDAGMGLLVWTLAVVWATDVGAYFAGRIIGGPKLAPRISPSKTWAGLLGGMVAAAGAGWGVNLLFALPFDPVMSAGLAAVLACVAQAGDFYESHMKRQAGVKDSGHLLPGHGGVMDRLDGLVPVAVVVASAVWLQANL